MCDIYSQNTTNTCIYIPNHPSYVFELKSLISYTNILSDLKKAIEECVNFITNPF